mmetsp:Transcript_4672/g.15491  ORF Transcript_4672/g.15491 Transcript_4672/m.15491 type:complete len:260 (+) Transcript_4672:868-1647(+)
MAASSRSPGSAAASAARSRAVRSSPPGPTARAPARGTRRGPMFSTRPKTGSFVFLQKFSSLRTSAIEASWGVVTTTAPSRGPRARLRYCTALMCSSEVPGGVSIISASSAPQSTSVRNCLMRPFLRGPRQMTASSWPGSRKPMLITPISTPSSSSAPPSAGGGSSETQTGDQPVPELCTVAPCTPSMRGALGPQMSTSRRPTLRPRAARPKASCAATVLLPTPPFPLSTRTLRRTPASWEATSATAGSSSLAAPEAQSF